MFICSVFQFFIFTRSFAWAYFKADALRLELSFLQADRILFETALVELL
jgi:hypothetical protein